MEFTLKAPWAQFKLSEADFIMLRELLPCDTAINRLGESTREISLEKDEVAVLRQALRKVPDTPYVPLGEETPEELSRARLIKALDLFLV